MDHCYGYLVPRPVRLEMSSFQRSWRVWLEWRIRRVPVLQKLLFSDARCHHFFPCGFHSHTFIALKIKSQRIPGEQSTNTREKCLKRERNVLKLSVTIVLGFALCWLPLSIVWFMMNFNSDRTITSSWGFYYFWSVSLFLAMSNCAINPWICVCFGGNYRQGLKNLLCQLLFFWSWRWSRCTVVWPPEF